MKRAPKDDRSAPAADPSILMAPAGVRSLPLAALPVSTRLAGLAEKLPARTLGDFHGRAISDLAAAGNCGRKTIDELIQLISRAASGEFGAGRNASDKEAPLKLLSLIDSAIAKLSPDEVQVIFERAGRQKLPPQTLQQIGTRMDLTRESIRKIQDKATAKIRVAWGPQIPQLLDALRTRLLSEVCPLTPELLTIWVKGAPIESKLTRLGQARLIGMLDESMPCWPGGHYGEGGADDDGRRFVEAIVNIVDANSGRVTLVDAFSQIRQQRGFRRLDVSEFLRRLPKVRRIVVEFDNPERPAMRFGKTTVPPFAARVLADSKGPLSPEEIRRRGILRFGSVIKRCGIRSLEGELRQLPGVYQFGPHLFGTRQHFRIAPQRWKEVGTAFARLLRREDRPLSTLEAVRDGLLVGLNGAGPHEVALILREDPRFTDLGWFLFSLSK